jgi:hypothetical protein
MSRDSNRAPNSTATQKLESDPFVALKWKVQMKPHRKTLAIYK